MTDTDMCEVHNIPRPVAVGPSRPHRNCQKAGHPATPSPPPRIGTPSEPTGDRMSARRSTEHAERQLDALLKSAVHDNRHFLPYV